MKILVVDDEALIRSVVVEYAENEGYEVIEAENGLEAVEIVRYDPSVDLMICDIMMPKMDGYTAYEEIKKIRNLPTIMLSARGEEYDKLMGFQLGIDDYLTKPFSPKELVARIKAVMKRYLERTEGELFRYKGLTIDFKGRVVTVDDQEVKLTPKEYELLTYFVTNPNIALSREQLLNQIWGYDFFGDDRTIDTHVKMLRNNLGPYRDLIVTVRSMGYNFEIKEK